MRMSPRGLDVAFNACHVLWTFQPLALLPPIRTAPLTEPPPLVMVNVTPSRVTNLMGEMELVHCKQEAPNKSGMNPQNIPQAYGILCDGRPRGLQMYPYLQHDVVGCIASPCRHLHCHIGVRDAEGGHSHNGVDGQTRAPLSAILIHHACHMTSTSTTD